MVLLSADVKKAFPSIPRGKMLNAVKDMGVTGNLYRAVAATYADNTSVMLTSDRQRRTVREGGVLLPCLYNIFIWPGSYER